MTTHQSWETENARLAAEHEAAAVEARREASLDAGGAPSSQVEYPWRAAVRSGVQALVALAPVAAVLIPVLADWLRESADILPAAVVGWGLGALAVAASLASLVSRVMAAPGVDAWIRRWLPALAPSSPEAAARDRTDLP